MSNEDFSECKFCEHISKTGSRSKISMELTEYLRRVSEWGADGGGAALKEGNEALNDMEVAETRRLLANKTTFNE